MYCGSGEKTQGPGGSSSEILGEMGHRIYKSKYSVEWVGVSVILDQNEQNSKAVSLLGHKEDSFGDVN